jgi:hypothetical protein
MLHFDLGLLMEQQNTRRIKMKNLSKGLPRPSLPRHHVVIIGIALTASLFPIPTALAIPIPVDLGPTGIVLDHRIVSLTAPNVDFQGQNITLDFSFQSGEFIRLFTATHFFQMDATFRINNAPIPQNFAGSGFLTDINGFALGPSVTLEAFPLINGVNQITGVDLVLRPLTSNAVPADAYGVHLDLTLPNSPGFGFVSSPNPSGFAVFGDIFGIGPGVPADVVPEGGGTSAFFAVGLTALIAAKICFRRTVVLRSPHATARFV